VTERGTETIISAAHPTRKARLRADEVALLAALGFLAVVDWAHAHGAFLAAPASLTIVALLFPISALALGEATDGWRYWARELLPAPVIPYIFLNLGNLIPLVNPHVHDAALEGLDRLLLGPEAQAALYNLPLPGWLADLLTLAYSSFFFLPVILVVTLAYRRDRSLPRVAAAVVFTFLVSYAGYFVVPAYGPRTTVAEQRYATLPAGLIGERLRDLLDHWEKTKTDAFPSGHTMVTLAVLFCARRRYRRLYAALLPVGALLIAATILLTYHYVVDVLAAVPLAALSIALAAWLAGPVPRAERIPVPHV
jgi:membrane-associated phospholipid phosphatase